MRLLIGLMVLAALVAPVAADKTKFELDGQKLRVPGPVVYESGQAIVSASSAPTLEHVVKYLAARKKVTTLRIEVHSDATGSDEFNLKLSVARALATAKALVALGADCKRLLPVGFGETRPIASNKTAAGRAANRRTDFVNAALKGKPIDDAAIDGGGVVAGDPCSSDL